ncbi:MAG TPA: TonB family protein [Rhodocyclaceae bacterium]|nr:TonB family protein [Rhodocyclaceae bacterium]
MYRLALAREARRHKRYPVQAIDAGWGGTAEVRVAVRADGVAQSAALEKSSGHAVLDDAALDMLRHALTATPVPPALRGQAFAVNLPVVFELPE